MATEPNSATNSTNPQVDPLVREFHDKFQLAAEFAEPYFLAGTRLYKLWRGKLPDALQGTFSKVMLNAAHASVQDRIPKYLANLFAQKVSVEASDPYSEFVKDDAEAWLQDYMYAPDKLNIEATIMPALQAAGVFGTGYRMPCIRHVKRGDAYREIVTVMDVDYFQILPAANAGGLVNPLNNLDEQAIPYFFQVDWLTADDIEGRYGKYKGFKKDAFAKMKESAPYTDTDLDRGYYEKFAVIAGVSYGTTKSDYQRKLNDIEGKDGKRRIVYWFGRDFFRIIVQDYWLVYDGPNPMGDTGMLPLVKYCITPDFTNWYGISGLEMAEDIIIARIMNLNFRLDHLLKVMFPTKWIRQDVADGHDESYWADRPGAVHFFPDRADIRHAIHYDRAPEVTQQTFIEDDRMMLYIQEVLGLPNYSKGMSGEGTLANETASGILSLIKQAQGRMGMESMQLEYTGLAQEARLLLLLAQKAISEPMTVRAPQAADGFKWTTVSPEVFEGQFTVKTHGTRYIEQREQAFQKLLALYPLWNNNPLYDQHELHRQINEVADVLPDASKALLPPAAPEGMAPEMGEFPEPGGMAAQQNIQNPARSVRNRNTVQPDTGATVSAGYGL